MRFLLSEIRRFVVWTTRDGQALFWNVVFFVLLQVLVCAGFAAGDPATALLLSASVMGLTLLSGGLYGVGVGLAGMRDDGVLLPYSVAPRRRRSVLAGFLVARALLLVTACSVELAVAATLFGVTPPRHLIATGVVVLLGAGASVGLGLLVAAVARRRHTANALANLIFLPLVVVGGLALPQELLPQAMQAVAWPLPSAALIRGLIAIWGEARGMPDVVSSLLLLAAWTVAGVALGGLAFRWVSDGSTPSTATT